MLGGDTVEVGSHLFLLQLHTFGNFFWGALPSLLEQLAVPNVRKAHFAAKALKAQSEKWTPAADSARPSEFSQ